MALLRDSVEGVYLCTYSKKPSDSRTPTGGLGYGNFSTSSEVRGRVLISRRLGFRYERAGTGIGVSVWNTAGTARGPDAGVCEEDVEDVCNVVFIPPRNTAYFFSSFELSTGSKTQMPSWQRVAIARATCSARVPRAVDCPAVPVGNAGPER